MNFRARPLYWPACDQSVFAGLFHFKCCFDYGVFFFVVFFSAVSFENKVPTWPRLGTTWFWGYSCLFKGWRKWKESWCVLYTCKGGASRIWTNERVYQVSGRGMHALGCAWMGQFNEYRNMGETKYCVGGWKKVNTPLEFCLVVYLVWCGCFIWSNVAVKQICA